MSNMSKLSMLCYLQSWNEHFFPNCDGHNFTPFYIASNSTRDTPCRTTEHLLYLYLIYLRLGFAAYHISSNGGDESMCGGTTDTACRTLEHVLSLYYTSSQSRLEIITSKSLTIDKHLIVRFIFPTQY